MTQIVSVILLITKIIVLITTVLFGLFGFYEALKGPEDAKKLLKKLRIPLSYTQTLIIGYICFFLSCVFFYPAS